ncbi:MAG: ABC transporter permease [Chloroflexota bacterium]
MAATAPEQPAADSALAWALPRRRSRLALGLFQNPAAVASAVLLAVVLLVAVAAPLIAPYDPLAQDLSSRLAPPSAAHWAGTDRYGRDVLSRLIWGSRISLAVGVVAVGIGCAGGVALGLLSGYVGGFLDDAISRLVDALLAFPTILMALTLIAALGTGLTNVMVAVGIAIVPNISRLVRGSAMAIKEMDYVLAAHALGARRLHIMVRHVLPNLLSIVVVYATLAMPGAILAEAALTFLGVGIDPPTPTWGAIIADGRETLTAAPWVSASAALAIMLTVMAVNLIGDALRDALDPRLMGQGSMS